MPNAVHFTNSRLLALGQTACGLNHEVNQVSSRPADVTCSECTRSEPFNERLETAGPPAVKTIAHYQQVGGTEWETTCGLRSSDPLPPNGILLMPRWDMVDCPQCLQANARNYRHYAASAGGAYTVCGVDRTADVIPTADFWGVVTCPRCINIHSREKETDMPTEAEHYNAEFVERHQQRITDEHRHVWQMEDGPKWEHDCDSCIYLGTEHNVVKWDLYFCPQGTNPTVIARRGSAGDYLSGMSAVDVEPMLALAYLRAVKAGLFHTSDLPGLPG